MFNMSLFILFVFKEAHFHLYKGGYIKISLLPLPKLNSVLDVNIAVIML